MAFDPNEVVIAPFGHIFTGPVGTAFPTDIDDVPDSIDADWNDLGYLNEDGIQGTWDLETTDIRAWQAETPVRRIVNARTGEITVSLMEWSKETVELAMGGGTWTAGGGNTFSYTFPTADDSIAEFAVLFDVEDGDTHMAFAFYRATISGGVTTQFVRGTPALLPVTLSLLAGEATGDVGTIIGVQAAGS
jgi:hypothetical protein